jgi:hypothetical protein
LDIFVYTKFNSNDNDKVDDFIGMLSQASNTFGIKITETYFKVTIGLNQNDGYLNFYIYFVLKYNINSQCKQI